MISVLLTDLAYQQDTEMRFLGIRLNYNEVRHSFPHRLKLRFTNLFDGPAEGIDAPGNAVRREENQNRVFGEKEKRL